MSDPFTEATLRGELAAQDERLAYLERVEQAARDYLAALDRENAALDRYHETRFEVGFKKASEECGATRGDPAVQRAILRALLRDPR